MKPSQRLWNKGQITIFMMMAVVVLLIFALVFIAYSRESIDLSFSESSIQQYIDGCLKQTAEDGLELLGKQGGRIQLQDYVSAPHYGITYWLKDNTLSVPPAAEMELQLSGYVDRNIGRCIKNFEEFEHQGWTVEAGELSSSVSINQQEVSFSATYPITVGQQESTLFISQLHASVPIRLQHIHLTAQQAAQSMQQNGKIDLSASDMSGLNVTIFPYKQALIYQFADGQSELKNKPFVFNIAIS